MLGLPASTVYATSNSIYIIAIVVAAICTFLIYQSSAVVLENEKEAFEAYKIQAGKDVAAAYSEGVKAGKEAAEAKAEAAVAQQKAAEANERAAQAELQLATFRSPIQLDAHQVATVVSMLNGFEDGNVSVAASPATFNNSLFAEQLSKPLQVCAQMRT